MLKIHRRVIYETDSYDLFRKIPQNRPVRKANTDRIVRSLKEIDLGIEYPIKVGQAKDNKYDLIDGQHRFSARQAMGLNVFFEVTTNPDIVTHALPSVNTAQSRWSVQDLLQSYASQGYEQYGMLLDIAEGYNFPLNFLTNVLDSLPHKMNAFRAGNYQMPNDLHYTAQDIAQELDGLPERSTTLKEFRVLRAYHWLRKREGFNANVFKKQWEDNFHLFKKANGWADNCLELMRIYNMRNRKPLDYLVSELPKAAS